MKHLASFLLVVVLVSCTSGPVDADAVTSLTDQGIVPALEEADTAASDLAVSVETYCREPGEAALEDARQAWFAAKTAWEAAETATMYGPGSMLRTVAKVDYEPVDSEGIDELLASDTTIDVDYVDNRSAATRRGLGTVEYLLFGAVAPELAARACELLTATASVIANETSALVTAWTDSYQGGEPYRVTFTGELPTDSALAEVVLSMVDTLKRESSFELGRAIGVTSFEPRHEAIPEGPAGAGVDRYQAQLDGIRSLLTAGGESSLLALLDHRSEEVADRVESLLDEATAELASLDEPLADLVRDDPERLAPLQSVLADLVTVFEADVVSVLDITLGFSDTDGDSG